MKKCNHIFEHQNKLAGSQWYYTYSEQVNNWTTVLVFSICEDAKDNILGRGTEKDPNKNTQNKQNFYLVLLT